MKLTPFGMEVRKRRIERGETQSDVARALGVSVAFWSGIETGKKNVPQEQLRALVDHFKLDDADSRRLEMLAESSKEEVRVNVQRLNHPERELVVRFARKFERDGLTEVQLARLREILDLKEE